MSIETQQPSAGWYNVPTYPGGIRWWDGTQWVGAVHLPGGVVPSVAPPQLEPVRPLPPYTPPQPSSPIGWISFGLSLLSLLLFSGLLSSTPFAFVVIAVAAAGLILGVIALLRRRRGVRMRLWAPLVSVAVSSLYILLTTAILVSTSINANAAAIERLKNVPRTFPNNTELTRIENAEQNIVIAIQNEDGSGSGAPKKLTLQANNTVWADGIYLMTLPPGTWSIRYVRAADKHSYSVSVIGENKSEVATYDSATGLYVAKCPANDRTCVPLPLK